jgi:phage protein D
MPNSIDTLTANLVPGFRVEGQDETRLQSDLVSLEVESDEEGLTSAELVFLNWDRPTESEEPGYVWFDGQTLELGRNLEIVSGEGESEVVIFSGPITSVEGLFPELRPPEIRVRAEDPLFWLRMNARSRFFESMDDGTMSRNVLQDAGMSVDVQVSGSDRAESMQIEASDLRFLREKALAADARFVYENGRVLMVARRGSDAETPISLTRQDALLKFEANADLAHQRAEVHVNGWDVSAKSGIHGSASGSVLTSENESGGRTGPDFLSELSPGAVEHLHVDAPLTESEARTLAEMRLKRRARRFVTGKGVTSGTPSMKVGSKVDLVDLGPWFSGVWHVSKVRHTFDRSEGFRTRFEAERVDKGRSR